MVKPFASDLLVACSAFHQEVPVADGKVATRVQLMPMGTHQPRNGTPPVVILADRAQAEQVVAASNLYRGPTDMVIDYDHQTVRAPAVAGRAIASGWIKSLSVEDDGIWGEVEWTAKASAELTDREYRYISPYFAHRPDGRVTRIINAGLTNTPNLDLAAVASAMSSPTEHSSMKMISILALASALGLAEDADEAGVIAAIARNKSASDALTATASALGVTLGDDLTAVASAAAAVKTGKPDPAQFVPITVVTELRSEMSTMKAQLDGLATQRKADTIAAAVANGKLTPALKVHAETLDETSLASFLAAMPETGLGRATLSGGKADGGSDALTADELAVASAFGMTAEDFLKAKKEEVN